MNIKIHSIHFTADQKLLDFVENKMSKFNQLYDNIVAIEVFLRLINDQSANNKVAEIKIDIPGNDLFASRKSKSFEEATDQCIDALKVQIIRHKEKIRGK
ncbi:MAG: ribosome-associated translation inhibitor RaiA [Salinivirgaceae bacterium]|nr:ribosome-associated translation inhibitor RaiA [Salinivirgaceae bacterium]MDD4746844.1 ribosome-associated translation inhibitor RaiA [Salinivirgaceae bacterium]MDY0280147.1 ribosome-associated translation inhibitor RaiA [Salinivirgaceae bacterium]